MGLQGSEGEILGESVRVETALLYALYRQIALELCDGRDKRHGHLAHRAGQARPPSAKPSTRTGMPASCSTVARTSIALRPKPRLLGISKRGDLPPVASLDVM
jgi:hypothetical protein